MHNEPSRRLPEHLTQHQRRFSVSETGLVTFFWGSASIPTTSLLFF